MPIITIPEHRAKYLLYDNKPCVDDNADKCKDCLTRRVMSIGDTVGWTKMVTPTHTVNGQENFSFLCVSNSFILLYVLG